MNVMRTAGTALLAAAVALASTNARAQEQQPAPPPAPEQPPAQPEPPQTPGSAVTNSKVFNPDIAVIGDFLGAAGTNHVYPTPALEMHESEVALQAVVDPYSRADFFISFGQEGVDLEEGFLTLTALPGGLLTRVGKMRAAFGKVNTLHNHILTWTDRPLVTQNLVGGEDGIDDAGISVAKLISNPWIFLEATGQIFRGTAGEDNAGAALFQSTSRGELTYVGHVRAYHDITEDANLDLGFSYAHGHNGVSNGTETDPASMVTQLYGIDATYRWKPLQRSIYRSFVARSEFIWSRRDQADGLQSANGFYVSGDYQLGRRWFAGARLDQSAHATDASLTDKGTSVTLTYWPSEFSQVRAQYRFTKYETAPSITSNANELLFQFQFSIGAHGAHPF